jgi:carbamoyltransferase
MFILGINSAYHESSACLFDDGTLVAAAEEERFTRVKHAKSATVDNADELPLNAIRFCLDEAARRSGRAVELSDVAHIGYSMNPDKRYDWHLHWRHPYPIDRGDYGGRDGERTFLTKCLAVPGILKTLGFDGTFHFLDHHLCHAASSYYVTPFAHAAVLVIDGIAEHESTTLYRGDGLSLEPVRSVSYPHSLGFLWEKISTYLGFTEYDGAKIMALAAYGDPDRYRDAFARIVSIGRWFEVKDEIMKFRVPDYAPLERLFGLPRRDQPVEHVREAEQPYADVAAALQEVTERAVMVLVDEAKAVDSEYLCLSGGVALNCAAVGRVLREAGFRAVYVPPAAHDAGTAIGAAAYIRHGLLGCDDRVAQPSPYLGPSFTDDAIERALHETGVFYTRCPEGTIEEEVARLLADGNVVGWFNGRMEFGPRALGHRSLFADPRRLDVTTKLCFVKHRYEFDPFAPCVLQERLGDWFELPPTTNGSAHYMSANYRVRDDRGHEIPAVLHVNGTSRVQAVSPESEPRVYRILKAFERRTGTPVLLNTSFNDREPIVCTPADALQTALRTGVDFLVMGDFIVAAQENTVATTVPDIPLELYFEKLR